MLEINSGYAKFQIAKALVTCETHPDAATRERARQKVEKWAQILNGQLTGRVGCGSRTPVGSPGWVTLEVLTGGFATGNLLAGGALQDHEKQMLAGLPAVTEGQARLGLNAYFLTDDGLAELRSRLQTGSYAVEVPEEGALLVVAWLVEHNHHDLARQLVDVIAPWFDTLRFYPRPQLPAPGKGAQVYLQDVGTTIEVLRGIQRNWRIQAQKEAVEIWLPIYDQAVALFLETVVDGWPCRRYIDNWSDRALALLGRYRDLQKRCVQSNRLSSPKRHYGQLLSYLERCTADDKSLNVREVGHIRKILRGYVDKRGLPNSTQCIEVRRRQVFDVSGPEFRDIAQVLVQRLLHFPPSSALDNAHLLDEPVSSSEAIGSKLPERTPIPPGLQQKAARCLSDTLEGLVERRLITSSEQLATVLPQATASLCATGISNPVLRQLYGAIYGAFRKRRSLLLLNLAKQVQLEELPWIAVVESFKARNLTTQTVAIQALEETVSLALRAFPHAILPNKLLQEIQALVKIAQLDIPLVEELAADIFMGEFSPKYAASACKADELLKGSLYANYFDIDYDEVQHRDAFAQICARRAGVIRGSGWSIAGNGMWIEQQQILTTQNLAALTIGLNLRTLLSEDYLAMAKQCFRWICQRLQVKTQDWHLRLILIKNAAYAWRQMIFFLAMMSETEIDGFLSWMDSHFADASDSFRARFGPAVIGLKSAVKGHSPEDPLAGGRRFLGWTEKSHWLMEQK